MITSKEFKPFFDINNTSSVVVARVYQEEAKGVALKERIVHAERYDLERIEGDRWDYNQHAGAEKEATQNCFELARDGFNLVVWISPKSEIYEEGRLNIVLPDGDALGFDSWAIPLLLDENKSMELGMRLLELEGVSMDPITEVESLRRQPIGYKVEEGQQWIDKCRELMPELSVIWDEIESGEVDRRMMKIVRKVEMVKARVGGDNIRFEREMKKIGLSLNFAGDHGGSWLSQERGRGIGVIAMVKEGNIIQYSVGSTEGLTYCKKCGCWYSGEKCPICE